MRFDMSKFSNQGHDVALGIRERYLWELLSPPADDPVYKQLPGQFRAELHDRFMSPIYPFAFAALTFAFLGAPRTTRQSRNFSIGSSILAVFGLRMAGFACSVMAVKSPLAPLVQYLMLLGGDRRRPLDHHRRRRDRAAGRADGSDQQIERTSFAAFRAARHSMSMMTNTLGRYFAGRFVVSALGVFASIFVLLVLVDYIEMVRKTSGLVSASADHGRGDLAVPRAATARKDDAVLHPDRGDDLLSGAVAAAGTRGRARRRRFGVAVHRAGAGKRDRARNSGDGRLQSDVGRICANVSKRMEAELFGSAPGGGIQDAAGFWINQVNSDGQVIINAARSEQQGVRLTGLTVFRFDTDYQFKERIEAREATLEEGRWLFKSVRRYSLDGPPVDQDSFTLPTSLTPAQVRNSFSTPETVSFWQLPSYIRSSESSGFATAGYRLQYHKLIAQPFLLAAMVMLAASVSACGSSVSAACRRWF